MTAPVSTTAPRSPLEYEQMADLDTAAGNEAWNAGNYRRAISLWKLGAFWSQAARRARGGAR